MRAAEIAERVVRSKGAPLAAVACAARFKRPGGGPDWVIETGGACNTFFDLASLTKPMTAVAIAASGLSVDTQVRAFVPELAGASIGTVRVEDLLAHRTGLPAHAPLFEALERGEPWNASVAYERLFEACAVERDERGEYPPCYSDLGYMLAGIMLARHTHCVDAGDAIHKHVIVPLHLEGEAGTVRELRAHVCDFNERVAPTEDIAWRGGVVRGAVHDENAWALTAYGGSGHAGLFGTVNSVLTLGCAVLDAIDGIGEPFGSSTNVESLVRPRPGGTLRAGFDGKSESDSSAGREFGPNSFGHLGFTGTSFWIDPDAKIVAVLLTNRVHPTRDQNAIRDMRPIVHGELFRRARLLRETAR